MGYSIKQKIDICLMAESNPDMIQQDLAVWAQKRYGGSKPPSQTTISRILAKKDEYISLKEHEFKLVRRRRLTNPLLRKVLLEWISQCVWSNIPITAPIIISSAGNFWKQLPENMREGTGEFSYKWCSQFLSKVNINLNKIESELYNRLRVWTFEERDHLKDLLRGFDLKKIFTLGEVFISQDLPLDKSKYNDSSDFITCMFCVNADGSEKLDPFIIGRYENYPSFEGKSSIKAATKHGVTYHSNRKKWLTSTLFYDWLSVLDKRLALVNRDIVIVLDDSASHRVINIKLQRIRLLYTSSGSNFLPMSWGIENDFRLNFRISQYRKLIVQQRKQGDKSIPPTQEFTMANTFDLVKEAWDRVTPTRIQSAWKKSGILPNEITQHFARQRTFDDKLEVDLLSLIDDLKVTEKWDVLSLLDLSVEQKNNRAYLSNVEIIQCSIIDNYDDVNHDNGHSNRAPFSHTLGQGLPKLQRLGERLNSYSNMDFVNFSPSEFDIDSIDFDEQIPDADQTFHYPTTEIHNTQINIENNLQPMSELAPATYQRPGSDPWEIWNNVFEPSSDLSNRSATTEIGNRWGNINGLVDSQYQYHSNGLSHQLPDNVDNQYKVLIIDNFLSLVEQDGSLSISEVSLNEIRLLREQLLHSYGH